MISLVKSKVLQRLWIICKGTRQGVNKKVRILDCIESGECPKKVFFLPMLEESFKVFIALLKCIEDFGVIFQSISNNTELVRLTHHR